MSKTWPRWAGWLGFLLLLGSAVLIQWPAAGLASFVEQQSDGHWRLAAARGSVWSGEALLMTRPSPNVAWHPVQYIQWQWRWSALLKGRLQIDLQLERGQLQVLADAQGLGIEALSANLPASALLTSLPGVLGRYAWQGQLQAQSQAYRCDWPLRTCMGEIDLLWTGARANEVAGAPLGDYRFHLLGEGSALRVNLTTQAGRLQLSGKGEIVAGRGAARREMRFSGIAQTNAVDEVSLDTLLRALGRPAGEAGKYLLEYRS